MCVCVCVCVCVCACVQCVYTSAYVESGKKKGQDEICNALLDQAVYCCNVSCIHHFEPHTCISIQRFGALERRAILLLDIMSSEDIEAEGQNNEEDV